MSKSTKPNDSDLTNKDAGNDEQSPYEATREVVRRHLSNIDDEITDDDIKNAYTGEPIEEIKQDDATIKSRAKDLKRSHDEDEEADKDHDGFDDDDDNDIITPTSVIGS